MALIQGIHHVAMRCAVPEEYERVKAFYGTTLGLPIVREWDGGMMLDTGSGLIEVFNSADCQLPKGVIRHFAFNVPDVDACAKAVSDAGYEVFMAPHDIVIPSAPPFPARIAFCTGPLGEEIEFFHEK